MRVLTRTLFAMLLAVTPFISAQADDYADTIQVFRNAGESGTFFAKSYGYAVFPTIGKGGIGIGGAYGKGKVYAHGKQAGSTSMTQLTLGFQLGSQAYSQIIFFQDQRAFNEFTSGNFEFGAQASAVAITASASAGATTTGTSASAGGDQSKSTTTTAGTGYQKGMAVFTIAKGGLMYEASIGGQKFTYTPDQNGKH